MRAVDDFFFSSRRRHTRFDCDWSSDVCSSDLFPEVYSSGVSWSAGVVRTRYLNRSEEHTSELQSQSNLVCRLLLEKKKKYKPSCASSCPCRLGSLSHAPCEVVHPTRCTSGTCR